MNKSYKKTFYSSSVTFNFKIIKYAKYITTKLTNKCLRLNREITESERVMSWAKQCLTNKAYYTIDDFLREQYFHINLRNISIP